MEFAKLVLQDVLLVIQLIPLNVFLVKKDFISPTGPNVIHVVPDSMQLSIKMLKLGNVLPALNNTVKVVIPVFIVAMFVKQISKEQL